MLNEAWATDSKIWAVIRLAERQVGHAKTEFIVISTHINWSVIAFH
jgi:hypothetical protein